MAAPFVSMLLLGAGRGTRLGGDVPKGWLMLGGQSLIERCVRRLAQLAPKEQREIVLSVHDDDRVRYLAPALAHLTQLGLTRVVSGGDTRQASMRNALAACDPRGEIVLVHDAARPFFPLAAAVQTIAKSATCGGALLAVPTPDTLKEVDGTHVLRTQPRERLWSAQTPQVARRDLLRWLCSKCTKAIQVTQVAGWQSRCLYHRARTVR